MLITFERSTRHKRTMPVVHCKPDHSDLICKVCGEVIVEDDWPTAMVKWKRPSDAILCHSECDEQEVGEVGSWWPLVPLLTTKTVPTASLYKYLLTNKYIIDPKGVGLINELDHSTLSLGTKLAAYFQSPFFRAKGARATPKRLEPLVRVEKWGNRAKALALSEQQKAVLAGLPDSFDHSMVKARFENRPSAKRFLPKAIALGLVREVGVGQFIKTHAGAVPSPVAASARRKRVVSQIRLREPLKRLNGKIWPPGPQPWVREVG